MTESNLATQNPRFGGIRTFMRRHHTATVSKGDCDVAMVGIPFDTAASYRPGPRFGPSGIRDVSVLLRPSNLHHQVNALETLSVVDLGDVLTVPGDIQRTYQHVAKLWNQLAASEVLPIGLGGDHSVTLGELRGLAAHHGKLALVQLDAHCDTWDNYWGVRYTHGTPFRRASEEGLLNVSRSIQVGMRGSEYGPGDLDASRALGFKVVTTSEVMRMTPETVALMIRQRVGDALAFLTFDIDFFDPAFAPGTGTPEAGGPSSWFGLEIIRHLTDLRFVGFDVVEVSPPFDSGQITALLGATIAFEFLGLTAVAKLRPPASGG